MFPRLIMLAGLAAPVLASAADFNVATATNQVGLELFRQLAKDRVETNLVISPYSIESAMALVYPGSEGTTREELSRALHFPTADAPLAPAFAELRAALEIAANHSNEVAVRSHSGEQVRTKINGKIVELKEPPEMVMEWRAANRLFAQRGYAFRSAFLDLMRDGFAAPLERLDFRGDTEKARGVINSWVEEQTHQKIRDLIPGGGVTRDTSLVLVNALYLKAPWDTPFSMHATRPQPFHVHGTELRYRPTMERSASLAYAKEDNLTVIGLPYLGRDLQFLILLPDPNQSPDAIAANLTTEHLQRWSHLGGFESRKLIELYLPRFRVEGSTLPLGKPLRALGIKTAFDEPTGSANFDRIAPKKPDGYLAISEVFHQTFIAVDETGTEAAAATAVVLRTFGIMMDPEKPLEVRVDRPFLFAIQHRASGTCLFLGRITDPR
jgi:serpin B